MNRIVAKAGAATSQRIVALDILRGIFLIVILIDHIELYPSGYDLFTGRGRLMVSAAEGFFFMSGLLLGMVYKKRIPLGMKFIFKKMWTRGLQLYALSVVLTLLFTAAAIYLTHSFIKDGLFSTHNWPQIVSQTLQTRYSFGWGDFLTRFAKLMVFAPIGFFLLAKRKWWLLVGISVVTWIFRGQSFTAAWQAIFFGGMVVGFYWQQLSGYWQKLSAKAKSTSIKTVAFLTLVTFAFSWAGVFILSLLNQSLNNNDLSSGWVSFTNKWNWLHNYVWIYTQKWTLGPLRIVLFLLWFTTMFMLVNRYQRAISRYTKGFVELLGKNSLFVYVSHSIIVFIFQLYVIPRFTNSTKTNLAQNFIITTAAIAIQIFVTLAYRKVRLYNASKAALQNEKVRSFRLQTEGES